PTKVKLPPFTEVRIIKCTASRQRHGYSSWKQLYEDTVGNWPDLCRVSYCTQKAIYGAHVEVYAEPGVVYIIPMCAKNHSNNDWMRINANTFAACVEKEDTSGPSDTYSSNSDD
ncbi:Hypothetical predicted protein, partial [Paramuricea clavata]